MFILRRFLGPEKVETNTVLGDDYSIMYKIENPSEFEKCFNEFFGGTCDDDSKKIIAFVTFSDGSRVKPIWGGQPSYIMTDNGATFNRVS